MRFKILVIWHVVASVSYQIRACGLLVLKCCDSLLPEPHLIVGLLLIFAVKIRCYELNWICCYPWIFWLVVILPIRHAYYAHAHCFDEMLYMPCALDTLKLYMWIAILFLPSGLKALALMDVWLGRSSSPRSLPDSTLRLKESRHWGSKRVISSSG